MGDNRVPNSKCDFVEKTLLRNFDKYFFDLFDIKKYYVNLSKIFMPSDWREKDIRKILLC